MLVKMDVVLQMRHGSIRILRNISWKITKRDKAPPIFGRRMLDSLGCDYTKILLSAKGRYGDIIDATCRLKRDNNEKECERKIAALLSDSVVQNGEIVEKGGLHDEDMYVGLGSNSVKIVVTELKPRVSEAV